MLLFQAFTAYGDIALIVVQYSTVIMVILLHNVLIIAEDIRIGLFYALKLLPLQFSL
uniref:Uncharacterized protein n=1 Tax=Arundo donax TaxID=35708 RepID=A0A0A8YJF6_ARUDO